MAVTTTSQAKTVVSLLKLVSSGTILLRRVMTESPVAPHAQIPAAYNPSPSFGPIRGKASWLAHRSRSPDPTRGGRRADIALSIGLA
jgi:hypothetical protein